MKESFLSGLHTVRNIIIGGLLVASVGVISSAHADDDWRWREHQRHEHEWQVQHRDHGHWDHRYWNHDREEYGYRPPVVYYDPPPPSGLSFVFRAR